MGLLDNFEPESKYRPCKLGRIITELEPADKTILLEALNDLTKWNNRQLTQALNKRGIEIVVETIRAHRLQQCSCTKGI